MYGEARWFIAEQQSQIKAESCARTPEPAVLSAETKYKAAPSHPLKNVSNILLETVAFTGYILSWICIRSFFRTRPLFYGWVFFHPGVKIQKGKARERAPIIKLHRASRGWLALTSAYTERFLPPQKNSIDATLFLLFHDTLNLTIIKRLILSAVRYSV